MLLPLIIIEGISLLILRCNLIDKSPKETFFSDITQVVFDPGSKVISISNFIRITRKQCFSLRCLIHEISSFSLERLFLVAIQGPDLFHTKRVTPSSKEVEDFHPGSSREPRSHRLRKTRNFCAEV